MLPCAAFPVPFPSLFVQAQPAKLQCHPRRRRHH